MLGFDDLPQSELLALSRDTRIERLEVVRARNLAQDGTGRVARGSAAAERLAV